MTRKEYDLVFQAFKSYRVYMTDAEEVLSEKILDDLFYPGLTNSTDDMLLMQRYANESEINHLTLDKMNIIQI